MDMQSLWRQTSTLPAYAPLEGDREVEALVIGGGMAGLLCAYLLKEKGISPLVIEAGRIAGGVTQNTTAKITAQHNLIYDKLCKTLGREAARQYAGANQRAVERFAQIIAREGIACGFERKDAYVYSAKDRDKLEREAETAAFLGLPAEFTGEVPLPGFYLGAVLFRNQAQFHPLRFLAAIASGLDICEQTRALALEGRSVRTDRGVIRARHIVVATHFPFFDVPGYYFARMHQERSYVLALAGAAEVPGMFIGADTEGYSLRSAGELLLFGGAGHRTGKMTGPACYETLRQAARDWFPGSLEVAHWSAQDCVTLDGVPYAGPLSAALPDVYVATGFGKWGMTGSMAAAELISDRIAGRENPDGEVFDPRRFHAGASLGPLASNSWEAVKGLTKSALSIPTERLEHILPGQGAVVEYEGEKAGVYRDGHGELHIVSVRCPHMGCQLEWNGEELSWDCPCHGSRFDCHGNLLNNPAGRGLSDVAPA